MTPFIRGMVAATVQTFRLPTPIIEIGSYQVPGQEELINLRQFFRNQSYLGIDMRPGPGVDRAEDVESLTLPDRCAGTVFALSTFEHVRRFWRGIEEVKRITHPAGVLIISCPFYFHIHNHPSDYWRFTPEALDSLLEDQFPQRILGWQGPAKRPSNVWTVAFGPAYEQVSPDQIDSYTQSIRKHAHSPSEPGRTIRYTIARLFCGKGPFSPHLERDAFAIELRQRSIAKQRAA
jgi:hypothetical protein